MEQTDRQSTGDGNLQTAATTHLNAGSIKKSINSLFAHDRIQFLIIDTQGG